MIESLPCYNDTWEGGMKEKKMCECEMNVSAWNEWGSERKSTRSGGRRNE